MAKHPSEALQTPVGGLEWVIIDGDGKEDLNGNMQYTASLILDPNRVDSQTTEARAKEHKNFIKHVDNFWATNKPKGNYEIKGGIKPHKVPTGEKDEDGDNIYEETGKFVLFAKTRTTFTTKSGEEVPKVIKVFNAKGNEVNLNGKKIGNESKGRLGIVVTIFTAGKGKAITASGLSFYLNSIQLAKFVEYAGTGFDSIEDDEDAEFEGVNEMGGIAEEDESSAAPRLD